MNHPTHRGGRQAARVPALPATPPTPALAHHAPHAALLIDFDNVTLGIRSDLTKELRTLLNSDIIKGKVAVQRAYADWRRYPQYIVPLSESSIDLIFAPAFGTNKKNATDIRLAVDAIELVFTRPEIGTIILLSGDSDFSSLVLKLKEYGKYVIGVGIRESASDLLIQNCDEYYSYNDLAGLTREVEGPSAQRDPWALVAEAVQQMARNGDVMRSDRLKQVMQQIDPNFDERNAGFNRFSKFVTEAGGKGLLKVTKLENGQFEVAPASGAAVPAASPSPREEGGRGGRRGRGRGRGGRSRAEEPARETEAPPAKGRPKAPAAAGASRPGHLTLAAAFQLLSRALGELPVPAAAESVRARMAALHGREDPLLDSERFPRLLRQANDAEYADVRQGADGGLEVTPHRTDPALAMKPVVVSEETNGATPVAAPAALRFRRGARAVARPLALPLVGVVKVDDDPPSSAPAEATEGPAAEPARKGRGRRAKSAESTPKAPRKPRVRKGE